MIDDSAGNAQREREQPANPVKSLDCADSEKSLGSSVQSQRGDTVDAASPFRYAADAQDLDTVEPHDLVPPSSSDPPRGSETTRTQSFHAADAASLRYVLLRDATVEDLLVLARSPDGATQANAWSELWNRFSPRIYRYICRNLGHYATREEAEDLTSQTFAQAIAGFHGFHNTTRPPFTAWLFRIALNLLLRRREQLHTEREKRDEQMSKLLSGLPAPDQIANDQSPGYSPGEPPRLTTSDFANEAGLRVDVERAIMQLSPLKRHCLARVSQGYKQREIAAELGIRPGHVARTIWEAYQELAIILGGYK